MACSSSFLRVHKKWIAVVCYAQIILSLTLTVHLQDVFDTLQNFFPFFCRRSWRSFKCVTTSLMSSLLLTGLLYLGYIFAREQRGLRFTSHTHNPLAERRAAASLLQLSPRTFAIWLKRGGHSYLPFWNLLGLTNVSTFSHFSTVPRSWMS